MHSNRFTRSRWVAFGAALAVAAGLTGTISIATASHPDPAPVLTPITPCRLMDTRSGAPVGVRTTPIVGTYTANVWGTNGECTIPSTAIGIVANVTVTNGTVDSFLTVWPADQSRPANASNLNWVARQAPTPNQVTVDLSANGQLAIYNYAGAVDVIVDITGYLSDHDHDDEYVKPLWAAVKFNGDIIRGRHALSAAHPSTGTFGVRFDQDVSKCAYAVTVTADIVGASAIVLPPALGFDPSVVIVGVSNSAGNLTDLAFSLTVTC